MTDVGSRIPGRSISGVWLLNRRTDPGEVPPGEGRLPRTVRLLGGGLGVVVTVSAVGLFLVPEVIIGTWPWSVSPLTARILAGWFALFGVVNVLVVRDPRWSAARVLVQSQVLGFTLVLLGVLRGWHNFDPSNPFTWGVVGGMVTYLGCLVVLYAGLERRRGR